MVTFHLNSHNKEIQDDMVHEANYVTHKWSVEGRIPYFDADTILRCPTRCNVSADGVHVKMWVDIMRAKVLFNRLCNAKNEWIGDVERFIDPVASLQ